LPAQHAHLERALDALRIVRREPRGGRRIDPRQPRMKRGPAVACGVGIEFRAQRRVGARQVVEPCVSAL
jgi:hypothetical protein